MTSPHLLVFDLDGTLLDSRDLAVAAVLEACRRAFASSSLPLPSLGAAEVLDCVGLASPHFFDRLLAPWPAAIRRDAEERCKVVEADLIRRGGMKVFPNVHAVLHDLVAAGHALAVASNCAPDYLAESLGRCDLAPFFVEALCPELRDGATKGELLGELVERFGPGAVMIGDRHGDAEAAAQVGIPFWGCAWGFGDAGELAGAARILESVDDLLDR